MYLVLLHPPALDFSVFQKRRNAGGVKAEANLLLGNGARKAFEAMVAIDGGYFGVWNSYC